MACDERHDEGRRECQRSEDQGYSACAEHRDQGYSTCAEHRDEGYSACAETRDQGYSTCTSWHPWLQWICLFSVWISNVVCVAWTWISNVVCVAWTWISNVVCVAWTWISNVVCVAWTEVSTFFCVVWERITGRVPRRAEPVDLSNLPPFPRGFLWGVATAAYQVEAGLTTCDWEAFTTSPAIGRRVAKLTEFAVGRRVELRPPGDAVGHQSISVLREDLRRARFLGMNCYRFSIEWSRLQPTGPGRDGGSAVLDPAGLAYYDEVFDLLDEFEMRPVVTLNHLTLPIWVLDPPRESSILSAVGLPTAVEDDLFRASLRGWETEATVNAFTEFVRAVVTRYRDRTDTWITLNEPVGSMIGVGYIGGVWPPGFNLDGDRARTAYFNLLRAHVKAYRAIKAVYGRSPSRVGIAHAMLFAKFSGDSPVATGAAVGAGIGAVAGGVVGFLAGGPAGAVGGASLGAVLGAGIGAVAGGAGNIHEAARNQFDYFYNDHFIDSLMTGQVDQAIQRRPEDRQLVDAREFYGLSSQAPWEPPLDFVGLNYYRSVYPNYDQVIAFAAGYTGGSFENDLHASGRSHALLNDLGWEICPNGFYEMIRKLAGYGRPVLITENGVPQQQDRCRAAYTIAHLQQVLRAIRDEMDVIGYIHWSLVDNFEWHESYRSEASFGLYEIDLPGDQVRRITEGAWGLRELITDRGISQAVLDRYGAIDPDGERVSLPVSSTGALWIAASGHEPARVHLSASGDGELRGAAFFRADRQWVALEDPSWDAATSTLRFVIHEPSDTLRTYVATLEAGTLVGTRTTGDRNWPWRASRLLPFGTWIIDDASRAVLGFDAAVLHDYEGDGLQGKRTREMATAEWSILDAASWDGGTLTFLVSRGSARATIDGDIMTGTLSRPKPTKGPRPRPRPWSATRATTGLPF